MPLQTLQYFRMHRALSRSFDLIMQGEKVLNQGGSNNVCMRHNNRCFHNLFEASIDLFRYPTSGRRAKCKFDEPHTLIVHLPTLTP